MSQVTPLVCIILDNRVFENYILADEPFAKLVNKNFCGKLVSSLKYPIKFDKRFKFTSTLISIQSFNLLMCELDNFTFKVLY